MRKVLIGLGLVLTLALGATSYGVAQDTGTPSQGQEAICDAASTPGATPQLIEDVSAGEAATPDATLEAIAATAVTFTCETPEATPIA